MKPVSTLPLWRLKNPDQAAVLRTTAAPVPLDTITTEGFQDLIDHMVRTMYAADGVGLAAPQIGQSIRLAVIARTVVDAPAPFVLINPTVSTISSQQVSLEEGCLSIPRVYGPVARAWALTLIALDRQGRRYTRRAEGLFARVIQHEVDHLNGTVFIDRASAITHGRHLL